MLFYPGLETVFPLLLTIRLAGYALFSYSVPEPCREGVAIWQMFCLLGLQGRREFGSAGDGALGTEDWGFEAVEDDSKCRQC